LRLIEHEERPASAGNVQVNVPGARTARRDQRRVRGDVAARAVAQERCPVLAPGDAPQHVAGVKPALVLPVEFELPTQVDPGGEHLHGVDEPLAEQGVGGV